jgi:hypothetical protein
MTECVVHVGIRCLFTLHGMTTIQDYGLTTPPNVMLPGSVLSAMLLSPDCMAPMSTSAIHWTRCSFPAAWEERTL